MQKLSLEIRVSDDVTVVYCRGRIVYDEAATLSEKLAELLPHSRQIVLELSGKLTRLASVFEIHPRPEDAILAFRGQLA